jgi:hypothetical protein
MNIISSHVYWDEKSKYHIQKEVASMDTLCGVTLGVSYMVVEGDIDLFDVMRSDRICKKCKSSYLKNKK